MTNEKLLAELERIMPGYTEANAAWHASWEDSRLACERAQREARRTWRGEELDR